MSRTVYTFNRYHLGDGLIFLHLLRALAKAHVSTPFVHFCHACYIPQLQESVMDLPNILLMPFESELWKLRQHEAIDTWKNCQRHWEDSPNRWNWSQHTLDHHVWTAKRMGFDSPFTCREHLLLDYPALSHGKINLNVVDFLIGDSAPSSGQYSEWADHTQKPFEPLIEALERKGWTVQRTSGFQKHEFSITCIGQESMLCRHHIMVANGPFWTTLNVHNNHHHEGRRRIVLLDNGENLNMPNIEQVPNVEAVMQIARTEGWI